MLEKLFIEILNMSYIGGIVIIAILFVRIFLNKVPKKLSYLLWSVALFRLLISFSFESVVSLIPVNPEPIPVEIGYAVTPKISTGMEMVDSSVNNSLPPAEVIASVNPIQVLLSIGMVIWIIIMSLLIIYGIGSYIKLKHQLSNSVMEEEGVFRSKHIATPFVIGITKPKIYLPDSVLESEREYILLHEQMHIKRNDHIFRFISYLVLCIHWFNPLVWVAFFASGKDMEMACDEAVIIDLGYDVKKEYSQSLLNFTTRRVKLSMNPLAFGEGDTKARIKNILSFKKPKTYFSLMAIMILVITFIGLLANPLNKRATPSFLGNQYRVEDILFDAPIYSFSYTKETAPEFSISSDYWLYTKEGRKNDWKAVGGLRGSELKKGELLSWIHFTDWLDEKTFEYIDKAQKIYRADANNENGVFYLVIESEDNQILIFYGYSAEQGASIRWIFEAEKVEVLEISLSSTELRKYRTEYVGNNSAVGNIVSQLQFPGYLEYKGISLETKSKPFDVTIILEENEEGTRVALDEKAQKLFEIDACILFSLVKNVDQISFRVDGESIKIKPIVYTRDWAYETIGANLWEESANEKSFVELLTLIREKLSYGADASVDFHILSEVSEENLLDQAISDAIMDYHSQYLSNGGYAFENHLNLSLEFDESEDVVSVYTLVLYNVYEKAESGIHELSGTHGPCKLTFKNIGNDIYELVEYWEPRDGAYYNTDIRTMFPDDIEDEAIDTQKHILLQKQLCYQQAVDTLDIDTDKVINDLLGIIMSLPMESSNPGNYIEAHPIEYRELIYYGDYTLEFIDQNRKSGDAGLKSKILELLYDEMTGKDI